MTDIEKIRRVFEDFEEGGLVSRDIDRVLRCVSDRVIGIGIGEQGFVRSKEDIRRVLESGIREDDRADYRLSYDHMEILLHEGGFANACGEVIITREENGAVTRSTLLQTLVFRKQGGEWKICGLHASAPTINEENMAAYPLKVAEKLLCSLREEIGEKAYQAEEQFQRAVLADTMAFYIVNFSKNCFEKCHVNREFCAEVEPGTPYERFVREHIPDYVAEEDQEDFLERLSIENVQRAIERNEKELSCEYRLLQPNGPARWAVTVIRLITDCFTGEHKGIMYVKDIDKQKIRELEMKSRAERDDMTGLYNKTAFVREVERALDGLEGAPAAFLMLDVDNFKAINDTFGHPFGDRVLIAAARILRIQFGEYGIIGRLGGDEFAVFVPGKDAREAAADCAGEMMERFRRIRTPGPSGVRITCSAGAVPVREGLSFEQLYQRADRALYRSKQQGKGRCTVDGGAVGASV